MGKLKFYFFFRCFGAAFRWRSLERARQWTILDFDWCVESRRKQDVSDRYSVSFAAYFLNSSLCLATSCRNLEFEFVSLILKFCLAKTPNWSTTSLSKFFKSMDYHWKIWLLSAQTMYFMIVFLIVLLFCSLLFSFCSIINDIYDWNDH